MLRRWRTARYLRQVSRDLAAISHALDRQNQLLARLVDHFAPADPLVDRATVTGETGVSFMDGVEASLVLDFITRTEAQTGHVPSDEEVLVFLADEKTTDLHKRLTERDAELQRIAEARRW